MRRKKSATSSEIEGSGKQKVTWPDEVVAIFSDICVKEVAKGNRPGTHFDKVGWSNVVKAFNELTGRDYDKKQLKNKWDSLKTDWKLWNSLLHKETGIGWDPAKKTVDASAEWWQNKIQINGEYRKFRDVGISPKKMDMFDKMFKDSTTEGKCVMIPSSGIHPRETVGDSMDDVISIDGEEDESTPIEDKGVTGGLKGKKGKNVKVGDAAKLAKQIDRLVEVVESMSTATSLHRSSQGTSIKEVMQVVSTLPGAETGSKLWWFATELFCSQEKREMFSVMTDPEIKLQFLIINQKRAEN